jgi:hypothetical protein
MFSVYAPDEHFVQNAPKQGLKVSEGIAHADISFGNQASA